MKQLGVDHDVGRQRGFCLTQRLFDAIGQVAGVHLRLFDHREHHARVSVDTGIAPLEFRRRNHGGDLFEQHRPLAGDSNRDPPKVVGHSFRTGTQPAQDADRPLSFTRHCEAAAGVDVAFLQSLLDILQCHAVFQQSGWVEPHLVLLLVASQNERLGHSGDLQQSRTDDPVGGRTQSQLPGCG